MYSETIDYYSKKIWAEAYEAKEKIKKELGLKNIEDADTLNQCIDLTTKLREASCDCAGWLESFVDMKQNGTFDKDAIEWAENTLKSLCRFEFALLDMYEECNPDPESIGKIIPVEWNMDDGIITINIECAMPHKKNHKYRSSPTFSYLLDESFKKQIGEIPDDIKIDKAFFFIEHHINRDTEELQKRDCDNYDTKHLIDLAAQYFLKYGDGPDYVRCGEAVIEDDHSCTKVCIVKPDEIGTYVGRETGFFSAFETPNRG